MLSLTTEQQLRQTAERLARLQRVTAALSAAVTREQVADVVMEHALPALNAAVGVIMLLTDDGKELVILRTVGYPQHLTEKWARFSADVPMAIPDAVRHQYIVILENWDERARRYPEFSHTRIPGSDGALVAIPLLIQDRAIGAIGLSFAEPRTFADDERTFMLALAGQCAQALERARLYDAERCARKQAQEEAAARKSLQDELLQAQKLESIGRLAGGIAHDFNNLLTAMMGCTDLAEQEIDDRDAVLMYLKLIRQATDRAEQLTRQMLAFARRQMIEPRSVNLNDLLYNLAPMLNRLIPENIQLATVLETHLHAVKVDASQFEQIVVNLVVNARDALPDGGRITLETHNAELDEDYARLHDDLHAGDYVMLAISDNGVGMDEATRLHIFEPFFTTKGVGRGTGLGLATVYGIVKQAGGHIWLYSEPDRGTTFKIFLPRTGEASQALPEVHKPPVSARGTETLLLVEDEPAVRTLSVSALRSCGYTVLEADEGEHALQVARKYGEKIDLLVTDVVMPRMNGKQLAQRLQAVRPELKVLYCSGYTENTVVHHGVLEEGIAFLSKPFTPSALAHKVREVLDETATDRQLRLHANLEVGDHFPA